MTSKKSVPEIAIVDDGNVDPLDIYDPSALVVSQSYEDQIRANQEPLEIAVRRPHKQWWIRTLDDPARFAQEFYLLEHEATRSVYLCVPKVAIELPERETVKKALIPSITSHGDVFLWPIRIPEETERGEKWSSSAMKAATQAQRKWIRLISNPRQGFYESMTNDALGEPTWPQWSKDFRKLLSIAFSNTTIADMEHEVIKELAGKRKDG